MSPTFLSDDEPVEVAPGRGDLRYSSAPPATWSSDGPFFGNRPISFAKMAAEQAWIMIAVMRLLTWSIRVPLKTYRRTAEGERVQLGPADHPLAAAIDQPWTNGFAAQFVLSLLGGLLVQGNSLTDVQDGAGNRLRFREVDWRTIAPIFEDPLQQASQIVGWTENLSDGGRPLARSTTMHVRWWSPLANVGISPLSALRYTLASEKAATEWAVNNLRNSWRPDGVVELSDEFLGMEAEERQKLLDQTRDGMRGALAGPDKAGLIPVLPPGVKWTDANHTTAVEAELIQQRMVNRVEVAAAYMIPPPMIAILERATYSNITTLAQVAYVDGLGPPLVLIEKTISAHIARDLLREPDVFTEFDFAGILRGDRLKEIQAIREAIGTAALTPNEGRDVLNLSRSDSPAADKLYLPRNNLRAIDEDDSNALGERSLAAQRLGLAKDKGIVSEEEARSMIGLSGATPDDDEPDPGSGDEPAGDDE